MGRPRPRMTLQLHHGDCLEVMRTLGDASVDAVVCDPPYGLSFMGKRWDYDVPTVEVWAECLRVLKPGGHLLAFAGTRTQHRMAVRIEDAGFEIRDMIAWVYGSGFPKSHNLEGDWQGWGTALKPALEPITMARKPLEGTVAANVLQHGTGALNVDGCRVQGEPSPSVERRTHAAPGASTGATGWDTPARPASYNEQRPGEQLGRWPANLIHDGSDEVVGLFPESKSTGGQSSLGAFRNGDVYGKGRDERWGDDPGYGDSGSAARFFYTAKASRQDREDGNTHPTVKPTDLMRYLCRLVTPPGGIVLDPFMGSGSTGKAALLEGFGFIGIEREATYHAIAQRRIRQAAAAGHQPSLALA
jgi:DNA modification methylase